MTLVGASNGFVSKEGIMLDLLQSLNPVAMSIVYIIVAILVIAVGLMIATRMKYNSIVSDLLNKQNRSNSVFKEKILNNMVEDYHDALIGKVEEVNTQAIIDKHIALQLNKQLVFEKVVSKASSLMIIFGLLGTFYGLTLSIGEIVGLLASTKGSLINDMTPIIDGLMNSLQGMSVAFITSLFGISGSIILTILAMFIGIEQAKEKMMIVCEEYLDHHVGKGQKTKPSIEQVSNTSFMHPSIEVTEKGMREMTKTVATHLEKVALEISNTTAALNGSISRFEKSIQYFSENTRNFAEFNHELRTNIQRMNVTFDDFTGYIKQSTTDLKHGHQVLANTLEIMNQTREGQR